MYMKSAGNLLAATIYLSTNLVTYCLESIASFLIASVDAITGSGLHLPEWHSQRYSNKPVYVEQEGQEVIGEIDVAATLANSRFPIKPDELIRKTRAILLSEFGTKEGFNPDDVLASDFQFVAPIIGPLPKKEFVKVFGDFKLREAIPDLANNATFHVDPMEPNRVWLLNRSTGTHTGPLKFGPSTIAATGTSIIKPPEASSLLFDEKGLCYTMTAGYTMDKRIGNTAGLGALLGILKAVGKAPPFREAQALNVPSFGFKGFTRFDLAFKSGK